MNGSGREEKPHILGSCTGCGYCFLLCLHNAVQFFEDSGYRINGKLCTNCGRCVFACPVDAVASVPGSCYGTEQIEWQLLEERGYDALVIGAGIGGLLSAAALSRKGKKTLVVERLNFAGGRFTHFDYEGAAINTGACHAVPFGKKGPFAEMIRSLDLPVRIISAGGMGSLLVSGKQYPWKGMMDFLAPFSRQEKLELQKLVPKVLKPGQIEEKDLSFGQWLSRHTSSRLIRSFFDRMFIFGCSMGIEEIDCLEAIEIIKKVYRAKAPGVIEGGCGFLIEKLVEQLHSRGGMVLTGTEAKAIITTNGQVTGVKVKNRITGSCKTLLTKLIISDVGPRDTYRLFQDDSYPPLSKDKKYNQPGQAVGALPIKSVQGPGQDESRLDLRETRGLCINMICDLPLLSGGSILYCLDTERVAGIAQPTGLDPALAPEGKHLLTAYQLLKSEDTAREAALGLKDLKAIFGEDFSRHCRVINRGVFKNGWPVNRAAQGRDYPPFSTVEGLYMVGDGCKAPGFVMVEGVAAQVKKVLDRIEEATC